MSPKYHKETLRKTLTDHGFVILSRPAVAGVSREFEVVLPPSDPVTRMNMLLDYVNNLQPVQSGKKFKHDNSKATLPPLDLSKLFIFPSNSNSNISGTDFMSKIDPPTSASLINRSNMVDIDERGNYTVGYFVGGGVKQRVDAVLSANGLRVFDMNWSDIEQKLDQIWKKLQRIIIDYEKSLSPNNQLRVKGDGSYQKRGFDSMSCTYSILGYYSNLPIHIEVIQNCCFYCNRKAARAAWSKYLKEKIDKNPNFMESLDQVDRDLSLVDENFEEIQQNYARNCKRMIGISFTTSFHNTQNIFVSKSNYLLTFTIPGSDQQRV